MLNQRIARSIQLKGWSVTGDLLPGASAESVVLQAQFKEIGYYTLQFSVDIPPGALAEANQIFTLARITWTVEGNSVTRLVSINNGTAVSGMGQSVHAEIFDWSLPGGGARYRVGTLLAPGTRPNSGNFPNLSINTQFPDIEDGRGLDLIATVAANGLQQFFIPPNVGINSVFIYAAPADLAAGGWVDYEDFISGSFQNSFQSRLSKDSFNKWIPLPAAATEIQVAVGAGYPLAGGVNFTPIYGIEG